LNGFDWLSEAILEASLHQLNLIIMKANGLIYFSIEVSCSNSVDQKRQLVSHANTFLLESGSMELLKLNCMSMLYAAMGKHADKSCFFGFINAINIVNKDKSNVCGWSIVVETKTMSHGVWESEEERRIQEKSGK
jgi:hypothetical protein